jgi:predicted HTH transcriptional regulator
MNWTWEHIERLVRDRVSESLQLEFKAAGAIAKTDGAKREITKDASAMANSAGGTIIYGIAEDSTVATRLEPLDRTFSKEWFEQVLDGIQPNLDGVQCYKVRNPHNSDEAIFEKTKGSVLDMRQNQTTCSQNV